MLNHFVPALALTAAVAAAPIVQADDFTVDAPITSVKVHRNYGAIVTRSFALDLPAGEHQIIIADLPEAMDGEYALRATVTKGEALISQVSLDEKFLPGLGRDTQQTLLAKLKVLETDQATDATAIEAVKMQLDFIQSMAREATKGDYASPADVLEALQQSFDFVKSNSAALLTEKQRLQFGMKNRSAEIDAVKAEIRQLGGKRYRAIEGTLAMFAQQPVKVGIDLQYLVRAAKWDIDAEANLDSAQSSTHLKLFARISQETSEDWNSVPITLSTTRPSLGVGIPAPEPVYFNLEDPNKQLAQMLDRVRSARITEEAEPAPPFLSKPGQADYFASDFDAEFILPVAATLLADGSEKRFLLRDYEAPSSTVVRLVPGQSNSAYVYSNATFSGVPFIEAPRVSLMRNSNFVGAGRWPNLQQNEPLQLPFGADPKVAIEVITVPSEDGDEGILNRKQVKETKQQYQVTNKHDVAMTVEVFDALPNAMNEDLEIERLRGTTAATEVDVDNQPGVILWRKTLAPGEIWTINHWYRMSYPTDQRIIQQ